jgi:type III secretion system HrpE/YscL family protein
MSFVLWFRDRKVGFGSGRVVMRAAEVPLCKSAAALRDQLEQLNEDEAARIAAAAEEARVKGYLAGREEGELQAREDMAQAVLEVTQSTAREHERLRGEVAALALEVVRKMIGHLPDDAVLVGLAETAASDMLPTQTMTLVVHPQQCDAVRARLAATATAAAGEGPQVRFEVRGDAACALDTCLIETEHGSVDASLNAQLERLARAWGVTEAIAEPKVAA